MFYSFNSWNTKATEGFTQRPSACAASANIRSGLASKEGSRIPFAAGGPVRICDCASSNYMHTLASAPFQLHMQTPDLCQMSKNSRTMSADTYNRLLVHDKFTFLRELTSRKKHHGNKSFYQHLCNVYGYLKSQSAPDEVCDAGLFHAIYGTEFYDFQSSAITREVVRGYIGEYAEELVYIFCGLRNGRFRSIINNTPGWSAEQHLDLCWVEFSNLLDHKGFRDVEERLEILGQTIRRLEAEAHENIDFSPPPFPPRLLSLDQVAFLSHNGWLPIDLSDTTQSAFQNVISEAQSFFAQEADVKKESYPSGSISNTQCTHTTKHSRQNADNFRWLLFCPRGKRIRNLQIPDKSRITL